MSLSGLVNRLWAWRYKIYTAVFFVLLLTSVPASLLVTVVHKLVPQASLSNVSGSFWQGKAQQALVSIDGVSLPLGELEWAIKPLSLLTLTPTLELASERVGQSASFTVSVAPTGNVTVKNLQGEFPLELLQSWFPLLVSGQVFFNLPELSLNGQTLKALQGDINLRQLVWQGGDVPMPLGNYQASLALQEEVINVQLNDRGAQLGIRGSVSAMLTGQYEMDLRLTEGQGLHPSVMKSVAWLGKKQGDEVVIERKGRWK